MKYDFLFFFFFVLFFHWQDLSSINAISDEFGFLYENFVYEKNK